MVELEICNRYDIMEGIWEVWEYVPRKMYRLRVSIQYFRLFSRKYTVEYFQLLRDINVNILKE